MLALLINRQSRNTFARNHSNAWVRVTRKCVIAGLILLVNCNRAFTEERKPEHHVFLVDVSGSMQTKPRKKPSEIEVRQERLKAWFKEHPNSKVTLMSFNTEVRQPQTFRLPNEESKAVEWVVGLSKEEARGTYLWRCLGSGLDIASGIAKDEQGPVTLHVYTDRKDTERSSSFEAVVERYPNIQRKEMESPDDFNLTVEPSHAPGSPDTLSPPPNSLSDVSTPVVAFEIQEPRIVSSGQLVHFVNKTLPPAESYSWTIQRNQPRRPAANTETKRSFWQRLFGPASPPDSATPASSIELEETEKLGEPLIHEFQNIGARPQSYTVRLVGTYPQKKVAAMPIIVLVQPTPPPPRWWDKISTWAGGLVSSGLLLKVLQVAAQFWTAKKSNHPEEARRSETRLWLWSGITVVCLIVWVFFFLKPFTPSVEEQHAAAEKSSLETAARVQSISRNSVPATQPNSFRQPPSPAPAINIIAPSEPVAGESGLASAGRSAGPFASIIFLGLIAVVLISLAAIVVFGLLRREKEAPFGGSVTEQLLEIERLSREEKISQADALALKEAVLRRFRQHYGIKR